MKDVPQHRFVIDRKEAAYKRLKEQYSTAMQFMCHYVHIGSIYDPWDGLGL